MKQCPVCKSIFPPDNDFCLIDGNALFSVSGSSPQPSSVVPTQVMSQIARSAQTPQATKPTLLYLLIGVLATMVIIGGAGLLWLALSRTNRDDPKSTAANPSSSKQTTTAATPAASATPVPVVTPAPVANAPAVPDIPTPSGRWSGDWTSPSGAYLTVVFDLRDTGYGRVEGTIDWTLRRTSRPDKMSKVGMSATEFVRGKYDPASRRFTLAGYRKDDPNGVLVMLDSYRLTLSGDERRLSGQARNGGSWNASVNLAR